MDLPKCGRERVIRLSEPTLHGRAGSTGSEKGGSRWQHLEQQLDEHIRILEVLCLSEC